MVSREQYYAVYKPLFFTVRGKRFGFERSRIDVRRKPYLDRWIIYLGWATLRLHKFWQGDDDRAVHDHPWSFITFPLSSYLELHEHCVVHDEDPPCDGSCSTESLRTVKAFRFHFRRAEFRHTVLGPRHGGKPFYTIVMTGPMRRPRWGFWPHSTEFIPYWEWQRFNDNPAMYRELKRIMK